MAGLKDLVLQELQKLPSDRLLNIKRDGTALIRCPYHAGGMERTPSFKINTDPNKGYFGRFYCWGCKQTGPWNVFAELFGLKKFRKGQVTEAVGAYLSELPEDNEIVPPDFTLMAKWPNKTEWRGIDPNTLTAFNARAIKFGRQSMMYLPVLVYKENKGGINCILTRPDKSVKAYLNTSGSWTESSLLGYDLARKRKKQPLWIVEGPRDTMHLYALGACVNGLIGSNVTREKIELIKQLNPPMVLGATDPDDAGDEAWYKLKEGLENFLPIMRVPFKEGTDAAQIKPKKYQYIEKQAARIIKGRK